MNTFDTKTNKQTDHQSYTPRIQRKQAATTLLGLIPRKEEFGELKAFPFISGAAAVCLVPLVLVQAARAEIYTSLTCMSNLFSFDKMVGEALPLMPEFTPEIEG